MTKNALASIFAAARELLRHPRALALVAALYVALIAACFLFVTIREATLWQVFLTGLTAAAAPLLFFIVQAASASYAVGATRPQELIKRTAQSFGKVLAISLPLILLAALSVYLLNKLENRVRLSPEERARAEASLSTSSDDEAESAPTTTAKPRPPVRWGYLLVSALRLLLLGVALPLVAVHLWLAAARDGLAAAFARSPRLIARAFSARAVLTYAVGMIFFALIPYFLITKRTPVSNNSLEIGIFGARILLAFSLMLFGWVMTMAALARGDDDGTAATVPGFNENHTHAAPTAATTVSN